MIEALLVGALACSTAASVGLTVCLRADVNVRTRVGVPSADPDRSRRLRRWAGRVGGAGALRPLRRTGLSERVRAAGWMASPDEIVGCRVFVGAGAALAAAMSPSPAPLLAPLVAVVGYRAPDLVLARAARKRRDEARRELPNVLDMLATAATAGVPGPLALRRAVSVTDGPLASDLRAAFDAVDLGARWREEVDEVARRLELDDLRRVAATLVRGEALGSAMADALRTLADDVREERRTAAADRARRAPVKMLFPLVFLVLPAFLLLTVVPVLVTTLSSIR
ncbi:MAG TPA: type II secretion system F family protein [Actinomycetota bacterium]